MRLETDYLVVGAGASGMAFVDALMEHSDADVIMVDRRQSPGGHWHDAYPFVRLHQPAAAYGVSSTPLGEDRIDCFGSNEGMYELASSAEICRYYADVMDKVLLPTGRVRFLPMHDFREVGPGNYQATSLLTGEVTSIHVRKKLVDATYIEPEIPANRPPQFEIGPGVAVIPPNDLVRVRTAPAGFTILGAGKTAMDACTWLLENGVPADAITWVRSRDIWAIDRAWTQPLDLVHTRARFNAEWLRATAQAADGPDMALKLEESGIFVRLDDGVPPTAFRGATISRAELANLKTIDNIVRCGRVERVGREGLTLTGGRVAQPPDQLYVDCTATGLRTLAPTPVFQGGRITLQYVTPGFACWSAATLAVVEAEAPEEQKNHLALPVVYSGDVKDLLHFTSAHLTSALRRSAVPGIRKWSAETRLNPARGLRERSSEPRVRAALDDAREWLRPALRNLEQRVGEAGSTTGLVAAG